MGKNRVHDNVTADFIDEVHRAEEKIDLFLKSRSEEAQEILSTAQSRIEGILKAAVEETAARTSELRQQVLDEAEDQGRQIRETGGIEVENELRRLLDHREPIVSLILKILMESRV